MRYFWSSKWKLQLAITSIRLHKPQFVILCRLELFIITSYYMVNSFHNRFSYPLSHFFVFHDASTCINHIQKFFFPTNFDLLLIHVIVYIDTNSLKALDHHEKLKRNFLKNFYDRLIQFALSSTLHQFVPSRLNYTYNNRHKSTACVHIIVHAR